MQFKFVFILIEFFELQQQFVILVLFAFCEFQLPRQFFEQPVVQQ